MADDKYSNFEIILNSESKIQIGIKRNDRSTKQFSVILRSGSFTISAEMRMFRQSFALPTSFSTSSISFGIAAERFSGAPLVMRIVSSTR